MDSIHNEDIGNYTINIYYDDYTESPRDWCNIGTMCCAHSRYTLGDGQEASIEHFEELEKAGAIILPLYLYDHSGITMNTTGFSCQWDSGQVGYIYVTPETIRKKYNVKRISKKLREDIINVLIAEVKEYDNYLRGESYCYTVEDKDGEVLDSCGGFLGDYEYCLDEAQSVAGYYCKQDLLHWNIIAEQTQRIGLTNQV